MYPSSSTCSSLICQVNNINSDINNINSDINDILQRITPIEFIPLVLLEPFATTTSLGTLTIQSDVEALDMEVNNIIANEIYADATYSPLISTNVIDTDTVNIGNTTITSSGSTLQLPANTTIGGSPVGGAPIQYFYWSPLSGNMASNWIVNASTSTTGPPQRQPFALPVNGVLRSFLVSAVFAPAGVLQVYPFTNFTISLYADNTVVGSATIATISAAGTYTFGNDSLNYNVSVGQLLSLQFTFSSGTLQTNVNYARASVGWIPS
jgi:hypothetical protein